MKLSYPYIFQGNDSEGEAGCGLTKTYVRFLLNCSTQYNTFYDDDGRVFLSDDEHQIIESGHSSLTSMLLDGCPMNTTRVVGDFTLLTPTQTNSVDPFTITWEQNSIDAAYMTFVSDYQFVINQPGYYYLLAQLAVDQVQGYTGPFSFDIRFNGHGGPDNAFAYSFWQDGIGPHAVLHYFKDWVNTGWFYMRGHLDASPLGNIDRYQSFLKVVRFE